MAENTVVEFDSRNRADIDHLGRGVFFMSRGMRGADWKTVTSLSSAEMDLLCESWATFKKSLEKKPEQK